MRRFTIARFTRSTTIAAAALSLTAAGCDGDDPAPTPTPDVTSDTTTPEPDTTPDTTPLEDVASDVAVTDPCEGDPCATVPGLKCDGNSVVTSTGPGVCTATDGAAVCTFTEASVACDEGEVCAAGACVTGGDACEYEFDTRVSYVTEIKLVGSDDCCFDFDAGAADGDEGDDNALGDLLAPDSLLGGVLAQQGFNINDTLAEQISSGNLVLLLETKGIDNLTTGTGITINGFYGTDTDENTENNAAGTSTFKANKTAFVEGTSNPYISFADGTITAGVLAAGPSIFNLNIPLLGANLSLAVEATSFEAEIAEGALGADRGVTMGGTTGGKLGGYIAIQGFADAFNTYLNTSCTCVGKKVPADPYVSVGSTSGSQPAAKLIVNVSGSGTCDETEDKTCFDIGKNLGSFGGVIGSAVKPDIARDGVYKDAISIGVRIKATSANVEEVDTCEAQ